MQDGDGANTGQKYFTRQDIENILKENPDITNDDFDATFYLVSSSADRFIEKSGDGRGGVFKLDYNEGMKTLVTKALTSMIDSKYENSQEADERKGGVFKLDYNEGMKTLVTKALTSMIDSKYENSQEADERKGLPVFVFTALLKRGLVEEDKLPIVLKHPLNELLQEISRLKADGFVNVVTKDPSYEFHPKECGFLYGVDLLKVARNQLQIVLQYQANYINRRLYEKSQIVPTKIHKQKVARMIEYVKKTCPEEEMEEMLQDVNNEFDHGKRTKIRRYRQFRDYLKKVEMMLNESIWVIYKYQQIEERRRKDQGVSNTKTRKRGPTSYDNDSEAKRFKY
uniref:Uncharacterized protein n=1 Tax=Panagrolaimus sp. JU765 TaxID=591449 RepID=A0AC34QYQ0_9BILA